MSPASFPSRPEILYMEVTSRLSFGERGGNMVGSRLAIMVFPDPGGPIISIW